MVPPPAPSFCVPTRPCVPWPPARQSRAPAAAVACPFRLYCMRAAVLRELGSPPELGEVDEPTGDVVEVLAAPINPVDVGVASGAYVAGHPPLPYVPGCEAVGRTADGRTVWVFGGGFGLSTDGGIAEQAAIGDAVAVEVPDGADPALAAGLGIAGLAGWLPFAWRAPLAGGERVLVLGATGSVGLVAVQAAKLLGAARVVAAGRDEERLERAAALGADATVRIGEDGDLATAFREAAGDERHVRRQEQGDRLVDGLGGER